VIRLPSVIFAICIACGAAGGGLRRHEGPQDWHQSVLGTGEVRSLSLGVQPAEPEESDMEELHHAVKDQAGQTLETAQNINVTENILGDLRMFKHYLMPGTLPNVRKKFFEMVFVLLAVLWLAFYKVYIYENDRSQDTHRWPSEEALGIKVREDPESIRPMANPDLILVFHHPDHAYADKDNKIDKALLETALMTKKKESVDKDGVAVSEEVAHEFQKCMELRKRSDQSKDSVGDDGKAAAEMTFREVRIALLQDIFSFLPKEGFDVSAFSSIDGDEIHVCIALHNEETIRHLVRSQGLKLQIQNSVVTDALNIGQDKTEYESSPPFVAYNATISANVLGEGKTDLDFFEVFGKHHGGGTILAGQRRIRMICQYLGRFVNLDYAVQNGLIVEWYPAHSPVRLAGLQRCWSRWSLLTDMSFVQPVSLLNDYFGSRVAFIFAWVGVYCKLLLALVPVAILVEAINYAAAMAGRTEYWNRGSCLGFSIIVVIWAKFAEKMWAREQEYLIALWDLASFEHDRSTRPDFVGVLQPSAVDTNKEELYYSGRKYMLRMGLSWVITLAYCAFNALVVSLWIDVNAGDLKPIASIILAVIVMVFTNVFNFMAEAMTIAENHKYQSDYYDSYLKKMFLSNFINQYSAFFYIAVKQQFMPNGCLTIDGIPDNCTGMIQRQLPITLASLAVMRLVQVVVATLLVKVKLWWESRGLDNVEYAFVEEQSKFGDFRVREQIEVMTCLAITLGYVLIFGAIAPRIIPLCFLVFAVQLRAAAMIVTTAAHRTVPRVNLGMGSWLDIVRGLLTIGVIFSGYLLVQFGPLFRGVAVLTKMTCLFLYLFFILLVWALLDTMLSGRCPKTAVLSARRDYVQKQLTLKNEKAVKKKEEAKENVGRKPSGTGWFGSKGTQGASEAELPTGRARAKTWAEKHGEGAVEWANEIASEDWRNIPGLDKGWKPAPQDVTA